MDEADSYTGRFAPSPTGPLHFGSLLAAVASYLEARTRGGRWLVRIEDIDPPRQQRGADRLIIDALQRYGFEWDGEVSYQSQSSKLHEAARDRLIDAGLAYPCTCSRKMLADAPRGPLGSVYPGTCRNGSSGAEAAIRLRTNAEAVEFADRLQGPHRQCLEPESGDFIVYRRDGLVAYHLAVVVDDHKHGVTDIVRGMDLMDSTPRQIWLQRCLGYATPGYAHIPVVVHPDGSKLSKLTGAPPIPTVEVRPTLTAALAALKQDPPGALAEASLDGIWTWAMENWNLAALAGLETVADPS